MTYNAGTSGGGSGQLASMSAPQSMTTTYSAYDALGRATSTVLPGSRTLGVGYDARGNLTSITPPGETAHSMPTNGNDQLRVYEPPALTGINTSTTYWYNGDRQPLLIQRPDGNPISLTYDDAGRLTQATHAVRSITYAYETSSPPALAYDRLTSVATSDNETVTYAYPAAGSLVSSVSWSGAVNGSVSYTYDGALRLASETAGSLAANFSYDADQLLTEVDVPSASATFSLTRDPNNGPAQFTGDVDNAQRYNGMLWQSNSSFRALLQEPPTVYSTSMSEANMLPLPATS